MASTNLPFLRSTHPLQTRGGPYMTHQGSAASRCGAPLVRQQVLRREASPSMSPKLATKRARAASGTSTMQSHFCARPISEFVRVHWRRSPTRRRASLNVLSQKCRASFKISRKCRADSSFSLAFLASLKERICTFPTLGHSASSFVTDCFRSSRTPRPRESCRSTCLLISFSHVQ